jgi:short subunit dehydrogenase-like uncharacterized protein
MQILLYGANGYTAELILDLFLKKKIRPILAGRSHKKIEPIAQKTGLEMRIFDLNDPKSVDSGLKNVQIVLHCAGPFVFTAQQMMDGCLRNGCHYLDITGEFPVFEAAARMDSAAKTANLMFMPGVGFDVVPTDCLSLFLKNKLPDATHLRLAFAQPGGQLSRGTQKSMTNKLGDGGMIRENGKLTVVPLGHKSRQINFGEKSFLTMTIPWGDVATAFYTTKIPNIEVYSLVHPKTYAKLKWIRPFMSLLKIGFLKKIALSRVEKMPAGPDENRRENSKTWLWGQVENAKGEIIEARFQTPNGYSTTAETAVLIIEKIRNGHFKAGFQTPAAVFGENLIQEIAGVSPFKI